MTLIEITGLEKSYQGVRALVDVDLQILAGEIHALCGENGAGKSTLNRILAGVVTPNGGNVNVNGNPLTFGSVSASEVAGIAMVHQESAAFLSLNAVDNHQLMREPTQLGGLWLDRAEMRKRTIASLADFGETFDPDISLEHRSLAQRQMVAIARAVAAKCQLLILDEPTASLSVRESDALFAAVRKMRSQGVSILYVSHRLEEIFALADRVTVLRDGTRVATRLISETSQDELIRLMVGRDLEFSPKLPCSIGKPILEVKGLCRHGSFQDINLHVRAGEVVGLAGLVGAGRSEIARAIFGLDSVDSGEVWVDGNRVSASAISSGLALVPEDRQHEGLHLPLSLRDNMAMAARFGKHGLIDVKAEKANSDRFFKALSIKAASDLAPASSLSGGNQQKVLLAKWLATGPKALILDEPTRGVDVGSKEQIHRFIADLARQGVAVLVISSELPEILALADRVLVLRQGKLSGELLAQDASPERILALALPTEEDDHRSDQSTQGLKREVAVGSLLALTLIAATALNPAFISGTNLRDMLVKVAPAVIVGSMMTLVILAREIDISVGSLMGLCAATLGIACSADRLGLPVWQGVGLCLLVGAAGGLINGLLVAKARIPSIIVTLGMLTVLRGITERLMGGKWIEHLPDGLRAFGTGAVLGIPYSVIMAGVTALGAIWITKRTRFGLHVFALGSNPAAAAVQGVKVDRVRLGIFMLTGLAAATAALFSATQLQVIESGFGNGFELVAVASVIVGGTSIRGGRGSVIGTVLGATLLGIIATVLIFLKLGESATYWERAIQGGFILIAVLGDNLGRRARKAV